MQHENDAILARLQAERIQARHDDTGGSVFVVMVPVRNDLEIGIAIDGGFSVALYDVANEDWPWLEDYAFYASTLDAVVSVIRNVTQAPNKNAGMETFKR